MSDADLMKDAAEALRVSARKPGLPVDPAWQEKQMHVAARKVRLAARQTARRR